MMLQALKEKTRQLHDRLERNRRLARLLERDVTMAEYRELLVRLYGFYHPLEAALGRRTEWEACGLSFDARRKVPLLRRDLAALGLPPDAAAALPCCTDLPDVSSFPRALGCLYVLEGATLGGRIISRRLQRSLRLDARHGGAFYAGYGDRVGPMWKAFCAAVDAFVAAQNVDQRVVVAAAAETFGKLDVWLDR